MLVTGAEDNNLVLVTLGQKFVKPSIIEAARSGMYNPFWPLNFFCLVNR